MQYIPTTNEPEELKRLYREQYGDTAWEYQNNVYDLLEFRLLNDVYEQKFGDCIGTMGVYDFAALNLEIRESLKTGIPYDSGVPDDAII